MLVKLSLNFKRIGEKKYIKSPFAVHVTAANLDIFIVDTLYSLAISVKFGMHNRGILPRYSRLLHKIKFFAALQYVIIGIKLEASGGITLNGNVGFGEPAEKKAFRVLPYTLVGINRVYRA